MKRTERYMQITDVWFCRMILLISAVSGLQETWVAFICCTNYFKISVFLHTNFVSP